MKKVFLLDSMAYIFRSFYAIRQMNSADGTPTNSLFGFIKSIEKVIKDFNPEQLIAVFDAGEKTFRNEIYPQYKANRSECPEDLKPQFELIKEYLRLRGIPIVIKKGFEADDLIGTLATQAKKTQTTTYICTGDKDMMQLVDDYTFVCQTHKDNLLIDSPKVYELLGIHPSQMIDYLSIMGDSSDNIPGLPGIGQKGAAALLQEFDNLDTVLQSADKISGKKKIEAITNHSELALLSKKLVTIDCQVDLEAPLEEIVNTPPNWQGLREFYEKYNMNQLVKSLDKIEASSSTNSKEPQLSLSSTLAQTNDDVQIHFTTITPTGFQNELISLKIIIDEKVFSLLDQEENHSWLETLQENRDLLKGHNCHFISNNFDILSHKLSSYQDMNFDFLVACWLINSDIIYQKTQTSGLELISAPLIEEANFNELLKQNVTDISSKKYSYKIIDSDFELNKLVEEISKKDEICLDTETSSLKPFEAELVGIGICFNKNEAYYIPFNGTIAKETLQNTLAPIFANPKLKIFGQNIKYDYEVLANHKIPIANISFDTLLASYLINPSANSHSLDYQVLHYFNYQKISIKDLFKQHKISCMSELDLETTKTYCCEDADFTWQLKQLHTKELKKKGLEKLFFELEIPLIKVIARMEQSGIAINAEKLNSMAQDFEQRIITLEQEIFEISDEEFNLASPKQLGDILFDKLNLPHGKKNKTGYSTDIHTLEKLRSIHPIAEKIITYRNLTKLKSTYIDTLPQEVNPQTKRIHSSFSQATAATGRLASSHPNLQNIPTRTKEGREIRSAFIAKPNHYFLACDYSQIELRIMAILSQDENLIKAFKQNLDIHTFTASLIFDTPLEEVTKEQRYNAKAVNFGVIYGQSSFGLANGLNIPVEKAKEFIKNYFIRYSSVQKFMGEAINFAQENSYSKTLFERRRYIPEIYHHKAAQRKFGERISINSPIQGSAADLIKVAMIEADKFLKENQLKSTMILQVHDELIFEVPQEELELMKEKIPNIMANCYQASIPFKVDTAIGTNWSECD